MKPVEPNVLRDMAIEFGSPFMDAHLQQTAYDYDVSGAYKALQTAIERYEAAGRRQEDLAVVLGAVSAVQAALSRRIANGLAWTDQFAALLNELGDE